MKNQLANIPLFRGIAENELDSLLSCLSGAEKSYRKGEVILSEGEPTDRLGIVLSGMAVICYTDISGSNSILGNAGPGAVFAEAYACVPEEPLLISVSAAEDTTVLFLQIGKIFSPCPNSCEFHTKLVRNLLTICARKSLQLSRRILHTSPKTIRGRLLSYFSECVKKSGADSFQIPYSRQQLADYLGVDRSAMCKELSKMQRDGIIRYRKESFAIQNRTALQNLY